MGAWIEIYENENGMAEYKVAPLVGAWIEIINGADFREESASLLSWERGLKFLVQSAIFHTFRSLLSWERGLKSTTAGYT